MKRMSDDALLITREDQDKRMPEIPCRSSSHEEEEDHISNLQDEVLISILSRLAAQGDIDQAARTSILSSRWRNLWRFSLKNLRFVFNVSDEEPSHICDYHSWYGSKCKEFVGRVNRVLELHLEDSIDDFHLFFMDDLSRYSRDIDGWLNFALCKKVKRLSIELAGDLNLYYLPLEVIIKGCQGVDTTLVSLRLNHVKVTGESVEYLLSVCRSLEDLSVSVSYLLEDLTVSGPSLKLKHLEIWDCWPLRRLRVHGVVNLVSFNYKGIRDACVTIQETPHLVNLSIVYAKNNNTLKILTQIPQLETLLLDFLSIGELKRVPIFPQLRELKQLELVLCSDVFNHSVCARLLEASPSLTELKLRFQGLEESDKEKQVKKLKHPLQHLKVVEIDGFIGCKLDFGVALYIIKNTQSLEKMIVDTSHAYSQDWNNEPEKREAARTFARQHLEPRLLPSGAELVVR